MATRQMTFLLLDFTLSGLTMFWCLHVNAGDVCSACHSAALCTWDEKFTESFETPGTSCTLNPLYLFGKELSPVTSNRVRVLREFAYLDYTCGNRHTTQDSCNSDILCIWSDALQLCNFYLDSQGHTLLLSLSCTGSFVEEYETCHFSHLRWDKCPTRCQLITQNVTLTLMCRPPSTPLMDFAEFYTRSISSLLTGNSSLWGRCPGSQALKETVLESNICIDILDTTSCQKALGCVWFGGMCITFHAAYLLWSTGGNNPGMETVLRAREDCLELNRTACSQPIFDLAVAPYSENIKGPTGMASGDSLSPGSLAAVVVGPVMGALLLAGAATIAIRMRRRLHVWAITPR